MQYVSTYSRLNEALQSAKKSLSAGDFENARLLIDRARMGAILHDGKVSVISRQPPGIYSLLTTKLRANVLSHRERYKSWRHRAA